MKKLIFIFICITGSMSAMSKNDFEEKNVTTVAQPIAKIVVTKEKEYRITTPPLEIPKKEKQEESSLLLALSPTFLWGGVYNNSPEEIQSSHY